MRPASSPTARGEGAGRAIGDSVIREGNSGPRERFRRHAGLAATLYLAGAIAAFAAAFADPRTDDYAGWIPVIVVLQIVWCLVLGRPSSRLAPGRREGLEAFTVILLVGIAGGASGALLDAAETPKGSTVGSVFWVLAVVATVCGVFRHARPRTFGASPARTNVVLLATLTLAAILGGTVSALCVVATSAPGESRPFLSGMLSWLGLLACGSGLAFTLGPWLWTAFVRQSSAISIPRATEVDRARRADIE